MYGVDGANESLFIEHTYLTIISKTIAQVAFFNSIPLGKDILSGKQFEDSSVHGVIEKDFFHWITFCRAGNTLITQIARHVQRFDFSSIKRIF